MMRRFAAALLVAAASSAGAQSGAAHAAHEAGSPSRPTVAPIGGRAAGDVTVTATDYAFQAPDTIEAGVVDIRLVNKGAELHHVQIVRLDGGRTLKDVFAAVQAGGPPPAWAVDVGGPNSPVPGGESLTSLELKPGHYAMLCFIPSPDGKPHVMKGMSKEFTVVAGAKGSGAARKAPATTLTLTDYDFTASKPLVAGRQVVRVVNRAQQSHEVVFARLAPGKTAQDFLAWAHKMEGPPPAAPVGGTSGIATNGWNDVTLNLEPGEYAMLCFLPDAKDGKPHVVHGMAKQFTVAARNASATHAH